MFLKCVFIHRKIEVKQIFTWIKKGLLCSPSIFLKPEEEINFQFFAILEKKKGGGVLSVKQPNQTFHDYNTQL